MLRNRSILAVFLAQLISSGLPAGEPDFYRYLRYPKGLLAGIGVNEVRQEGGPSATGYRRRTVVWWPRRGQDRIEVPHGAPFRTWTRNKGQDDPEALAGLCRNWTASDPEAFKAHLVGLRGFAVPTPNPDYGDEVLIPAAVLRLENGEQRAVVHHRPLSLMLSPRDHDFIFRVWKTAWPRLRASVSREPYVTAPRDLEAFPPDSPGCLVLESAHWRFQTGSETWVEDFYLLCPDEPEKQARYRKGTLQFAENLWTYVEASGAGMPFWREPGPRYKFAVTTGPAIKNGWEHLSPGNGGGYGCCTVYWCGGGPRNVKLSHEFFHSGYHGENGCNAGQHMLIPGQLEMFSHNFCYPWRHVMYADYQAGLWMIALGDNPNWGYGIVPVLGSLRAAAEPTLFHTVARLGQRKGLWENGIKGFGDFFGEYAARMVTVDFIDQPMLRCKYGMPEVSYVYPVYGRPGTYRISNAEAPRAYGFNIVRLEPDDGADEIAVDFQGFYEPSIHSDWRACIVAVDGNGRARYSPLWNKGAMAFRLAPMDAHLWLTVAATPAALPMREDAGWHGGLNPYFKGPHAPRFPWEVTLTGCRPGTPHRRQGDVVNLDELYTINNTNYYYDSAVKHEVPISCWEADATLAREKLAAMLPRIAAAARAVRARRDAGRGYDLYWLKDWWEYRKLERLEDLERRVKFLLRNSKGHRHPNGGGFVADNAHAAPTAYVGPNAMVLDGARVEDEACIKEYAVVIGPDAVVAGHAKVGGKAWVFGEVRIDGCARVLESVVLAARRRWREGYGAHSESFEGAAHITGTAVIKGEHIMYLCYATDQVLTGGLVVDYTAKIANRRSGVFHCGRFFRDPGYTWAYTPPARFGRSLDNALQAGALYANWQFDQPRSRLLEDAYVNNNGVLHGHPAFAREAGRKYLVLDGVDQYAEAPPSVADFDELTIAARIRFAGGEDRYLFDFGTGDDECFAFNAAGRDGRPVLGASHAGRTAVLRAPAPLPADRWVGLRVEMDGETAAIFFDGRRVAEGPFPFRPRAVFIGDRPEGNFIGRKRDGTGFFKGDIDSFRIYRKVHDDFDALDEVPCALTQEVTEETCKRARRLTETWRRRREAEKKEREEKKPPDPPAYRKLMEEKAELDRRLSRLRETVAEAEKAAPEERERLASGPIEKLAATTARLEALNEELKTWRKKLQVLALKRGGPQNPHAGIADERILQFQRALRFHTTADWDDRTPQEVRGEVPPKMKEWLERVRGY